MRRLAPLVLAPLLAGSLQAQQRTRSPHGDLKMECTTCHVSSGWTPIRVAKTFDHAKLGFALTGAHGTAACRACHQSLDFKGVKTDCVSCHIDHHRGELGANCSRCHSTRSFLDRDVMTRAHQLTRFPLQGGHLGVECSSCHTPGPQGSLQFVGTPLECVFCHKSDYNTAPNHVASGFPTTCLTCHNQVAWSRVSALGASSHPTSPIALTGVHANRQCADCHLAGQPYSAVQQTCDGCHHSDFVGAKDPDHMAAGFSTNCTTCHALVAGWAGATFLHATTPIDPKQGAHGAVTCSQCHTKTPYSSVPTTCDGCHHADYLATTNPSHTAAGYSTDCASCHQVVAGWAGATFNHPTSPLALTGQHAIPPRVCADCHTTTTYSSVPQTCDGCHHATYIGAMDPNHQAVGMAAFAAANCSNCHSPTSSSWTNPTWTHMAIVNPQPVSLPHKGATCSDCHQNATNYTITSCAKSGCHSSPTGP